jgi:hypothetical protein
MDKEMLNNSKLFEKQEIRWFSIEDMKKQKDEFRPFYYAIVKKILSRISAVRKFILAKSKMRSSLRKTRKYRTNKGG